MEYRLLVVDEEPAVRSRYAETLIAVPPAPDVAYTIVTVGSVAAAQLQATRQRFDLMIASLNLSGGGVELSYRLRDLYPGLRLLLLRDQNTNAAQLKLAAKLGARVIERSVEGEHLRTVVADLLGLTPAARSSTSLQPPPPIQQTLQPPPPPPPVRKVQPPSAPPPSQPPMRSLPPAPPPAKPPSTPNYGAERNISRPITIAPPQVILSPSQIEALRNDLAELGRQKGVRFVILADLNGQSIIHWDGMGKVDIHAVAALAAGDLVATLEIGQMMGSQRGCNLIVQEHEGQSVLVSRVGVEMLLLLATDQEVSLGWSRLAVRRTADHIAGVIGVLAA